MSEDKKETNDILEEAIASVKAAKKQATETPVEEKKAEPSQEELLKLIKELKSEISDIKKANEEDDLDDVDDDSEDDDDLDAEDDADDEDEKDDGDNSENEKLKSEIENLKKQLEERNKQSNSSTQQEGNSKTVKFKRKCFRWTIGCLSLIGAWVVVTILLGSIVTQCNSAVGTPSQEIENNSEESSIIQPELQEKGDVSEGENNSNESVSGTIEKKSKESAKKPVKIQPPIPKGEHAESIMFFRDYKWYFFGVCVFIFLCKILLRKENQWGLIARYVVFTGLLLYPMLSQDYAAYNEDDEFSNVLIFFGFFTAFFIIPTLYWFFGEISKCPECGTTYAFEEVRRDYDHALAPKYARNIDGKLKKDWRGNNYQVQTVYYRVTLRCKNCGYTKQVMRKVEEKI